VGAFLQGTFDELSRQLLSAPFGAVAQGAAAGAQQAAAPSAPAPSANGQAPAPVTTPSGAPATQAGPPEPGELAWLVNQALIEQARRHGMDLS
jgi:hypothetical protein